MNDEYAHRILLDIEKSVAGAHKELLEKLEQGFCLLDDRLGRQTNLWLGLCAVLLGLILWRVW